MWIIKSAVDQDGILGLNGDTYLLDDDGEVMEFETELEAKFFIADAGEDPMADYLDYVEVEYSDRVSL